MNEPRAVVTAKVPKAPKKPKRTLITYTYHPATKTYTVPAASMMQMIKDINDAKEKP